MCICFKALQNVIPSKFKPSSTHPKGCQPMQNRIRKSPSCKYVNIWVTINKSITKQKLRRLSVDPVYNYDNYKQFLQEKFGVDYKLSTHQVQLPEIYDFERCFCVLTVSGQSKALLHLWNQSKPSTIPSNKERKI